jgi:hypothetical protein
MADGLKAASQRDGLRPNAGSYARDLGIIFNNATENWSE